MTERPVNRRDMERRALLALTNIGPKSARMLVEAGINSRSQIENFGALAAFRRLSEMNPVSLNMLWALQGALPGLPYNRLPRAIKAQLLDELAPDSDEGQFKSDQ